MGRKETEKRLKSGAVGLLMSETLSLWNNQKLGQGCT